METAGPRPRNPAWFELETHDGLSDDPRRRCVLSHPVRLYPLARYLFTLVRGNHQLGSCTRLLTHYRLFPESPRWYLTKDRHRDAYKAICQLRLSKIQAARDLFYMDFGLQAERDAMSIGKHNRIKELVTVRRNRNAMIGSEIVMFMQQFCGVNVIAYYSSEIFLQANLPETSALAASLGFGIINWLFAIPAVYSKFINFSGRHGVLKLTSPSH